MSRLRSSSACSHSSFQVSGENLGFFFSKVFAIGSSGYKLSNRDSATEKRINATESKNLTFQTGSEKDVCLQRARLEGSLFPPERDVWLEPLIASKAVTARCYVQCRTPGFCKQPKYDFPLESLGVLHLEALLV